MAVDALQLRPRSTLALFDASLRVAFASSGLVAIVMPSAALLTYACFTLAEAIIRGQSLTIPSGLVVFSFLVRCFTQGAASHFLEQQLVSAAESTVKDSLRRALARLPGLIVAGTVHLVIDLLLILLTFGVGFFLVGAHLAIFPATMRGEGSALALYGTTSRLLGAARHTAPFLRLCNTLQLVVAVNLHLSTTFLVLLGQQLLALDLNFIDRFAALDNPVWLAVLAAATFAVFEPIRVATGVLLLIDGRVRQEGLDLISQVDQLPRRKRVKSTPITALSALLLCALPFTSAHAAEPSALRHRIERLVDECEMAPLVDLNTASELDTISARDQASLSRFVSRVERRAYDDEDCEAAEKDLRAGLTELSAANLSQSVAETTQARADAQAILNRPEFLIAPEKAEPQVEPSSDEPSRRWLVDKLVEMLKRFFDWLLSRERTQDVPSVKSADTEMVGANVVIVVIVGALLALLIFLVLQLLPKNRIADAAGQLSASGEVTLTSDPMSALSKRPETWAGLADALAAKGDFREAIRHLYLALLSTLHRTGAIDYDPAKSNWDYVLGFRSSGADKATFRELTVRFDVVWYGNLDTTAAAYAGFRSTVAPLLAPKEPSNA
jgi:hypothetical protein